MALSNGAINPHSDSNLALITWVPEREKLAAPLGKMGAQLRVPQPPTSW